MSAPLQRRRALGALALLALVALPAPAQPLPDSLAFQGMRWRNIGPNRGGRSLAVAGSTARPNEFWFGAVGGGAWKTTDAGQTWRPMTDGQLRSSSVGAIAVAPSNPDVVYVGMGETALRGNIMQGDGVYRTTDGGRTWTHLGLAATMAIGRIRVHPTNPDIAWVAALGNPSLPTPERGVFRTTDGGKT
ncbi:MAG: glycosyl hydrolase, partial [Gemmatimonadaceae bacterium]|nr:glycosyl hydrolase [Gemmatimonadaceae bacterium]